MNTYPALEGMRVLDLTRVLAGPYATMMLGDLGAEVIKVEPLSGDESRTWPPFLKNGESAYFMALNRNKKSITLNLKEENAKKIARKLAEKADVVLENFTPGVVRKLGIDYETMREKNPSLIYCSISGFGQDGPYRDKKAYDPIIQGMTGLMSITGDKKGPPVKVGIPITDLCAANHAVSAILAAYIAKLKKGEGQFIDVSLYDGMISLSTIMAMDYFATGEAPRRFGLDHIHRVPARAFRAKDGRYVQVAATSDDMFPKFCRLVGLEKMIDDPRCASNSLRVKHREEIMPIFEKQMLDKNSEDWLAIFEHAGIPTGLILDLKEVFASPHVAARNMTFTMEHPIEGEIPQLGFPYKMSLTPPSALHKPPILGENTETILRYDLGYSTEAIYDLRSKRVIG